MKTDFYTKAVLTVIAIFLGMIALQNIDLVSSAYAAKNIPAPETNRVEGINDRTDVYIDGCSSWATLNVKVVNPEDFK